MHEMQKMAEELAERVTDKTAPHEMWPWIDSLRQNGVSNDNAKRMIRVMLGAGWIPPSIVAEYKEVELEKMREEMVRMKKITDDMQEWYSKLDEFMKEKIK